MSLDKYGGDIPNRDTSSARESYTRAMMLIAEHITEDELQHSGIPEEQLYHVLATLIDTAREFNMDMTAYTDYVQDPASFIRKHQSLMRLVPIASIHDIINNVYGVCDGHIYNSTRKHATYMDAPLGFSLRYADEQIAMIAFRYDFMNSGTIHVDQIQGGTSDMYNPQSSKANRIRMRFSDGGAGTNGFGTFAILVDTMLTYAHRMSVHKIGIRKPEKNMWFNINTPTDKNRGAKLYEYMYKRMLLSNINAGEDDTYWHIEL